MAQRRNATLIERIVNPTDAVVAFRR